MIYKSSLDEKFSLSKQRGRELYRQKTLCLQWEANNFTPSTTDKFGCINPGLGQIMLRLDCRRLVMLSLKRWWNANVLALKPAKLKIMWWFPLETENNKGIFIPVRINKMVAYNNFHNIFRLFDVLTNFPFTTNETMRDYYL